MNQKRLIDIIPEAEDTCPVDEGWRQVIEPFLLSLSLPPDVVAQEAYCELEAAVSKRRYPGLTLSAVLRLETKPEAQQHNLRELRGRRTAGDSTDAALRPVLLIGDQGIGKTTWMLRFFSQEFRASSSYFYRLDGQAIAARSAGQSAQDFIKQSIREGLYESATRMHRRRGMETRGSQIPLKSVRSLSEREFADVLESVAADMAQQGVQGWIVLDNLDCLGADIQRFAIEYASSLATPDLTVTVAARPNSVGATALTDPVCVTVAPPLITEVLRLRAEVVRSMDAAKDIWRRFEHGEDLNLSWAPEAGRNEFLESLYQVVAESWGEFPSLYDMLCRIHCGDLRAVLDDVADLLRSGHYCSQIERRLAGQPWNEDEMVMACFRGAYRHHRQTEDSGGSFINLFDAECAQPLGRFLNACILQTMRSLTQERGITFDRLASELEMLGYHTAGVRLSVTRLMQRRLLRTVGRFNGQNDEIQSESEDQLALSPSGDHYLDKLAGDDRYVLRHGRRHQTWRQRRRPADEAAMRFGQ